MLNTDSKKILLVDDNRLVLALMSKALSKEGFECLKADSALEAIEILKDKIPDLILSDYEMPEMDGFQFRAYLMLDAVLKNIPFIFLTSISDETLMAKGLSLKAIDYILKDTPVHVVVSKINNLLQTVREQHQQSIRELSGIAQALNLRAIPKEIPKLKGFMLDFWHKSYQNYPGGDFIDFIVIDERYACVVLGDVMGKKWGAWFFSFSFLSYIRAAVRLCVFDGDYSTASILKKINKVIYHDPVLSDILSTLSIIMIDQQEGSITYSGAGDLPLLHYIAKEKKLELVKSTGLLLGVFQEGLYTEHSFKPGLGDQLILITDGIIDYENESGKMSDHNLFIKIIEPLLGVEDTFKQFQKNIFITQKSKEQIDDCSIIFIQKEAI